MSVHDPDRARFDALVERVDTRDWGVGATKDVEDLWGEVVSGECVVSFEEGTLVRTVEGVGLVLWRPAEPGRSWSFLSETLQRFSDGSVRYRDLEMSVGEKLLRDEDPAEAASRCLSEELGVEVALELGEATRQTTKLPSDSYPGTVRVYRTDVWHLEWPERLVRSEYREEQPKKTGLWHWRRLPLGVVAPAMSAHVR